MRSAFLTLLVAMNMLVAACVAPQPLPAANAADAPAATSYRLGSGDRFRLNVYNEPTLSGGEYSVDSDGDASLPLIGPIHVADMTVREAEAAITERYGAGYVNGPRVNIDITAFRPFYILGEVKRPGEYPFASGLTVLSAVARAEGFTFRADQRRIFVRRAGEAAEREVPLAANTPVMPGDTIRIIERFF